MLSFLKRNKNHNSDQLVQETSPPAKKSLFNRLQESLQRTRATLGVGLGNLFLGKKTIDAELLEKIETHLLTADVGIEATQTIINDLTARISRKQIDNPEVLFEALKTDLKTILASCESPLTINAAKHPHVVLMIGVNGSGKTTTIGKLANLFKEQGKSVLLAAGDTFRAAAIEQLQVWGERNNIPVIAQQTGADSASVIYDALSAAKARGIDVLIADTAGRLHTQLNLMEELKKIKRVLSKLDETAPHDIILVLDAGIGQNALQQAITFNEAVGITGLILTKLDGTAKGGIIFAIAKKLGIPIRFIGVGENMHDLQTFHAEEFVDALFSENSK